MGVVGLGWTDWDYQLSDLMTSYWVNFAATGNPNGDSLPDWPLYRTAHDEVLEFGASVGGTKHPRASQLDVFDAVFTPPPGG